MKYVDTNVLLRIMTGDNLELEGKAWAMLDACGTAEVYITEAVVDEVCFVLEFHDAYKLTHSDIAVYLGKIFHNAKFVVDTTVKQAIALFGDSPKLDFVDCLLVAKAGSKKSKVLSFDKALLAALK